MGLDNFKKITQIQWGLFCILGGVLAGILGNLVGPTPRNSAEQMGKALGATAAGGLFVVLGIGLIIAHFLRGKPAPTSKKSSGKASNVTRKKRSS